MINKMCVFCGSSKGHNEIYAAKAVELGSLLAGNNIELVYGGGNVGLMGVIADQVLLEGGKVTGVIPHFLFEWEVGHEGLTKLVKVDSMHERKLLMSEMADAFIAMPGGFGTLEELGEILTWIQLSIIKKPVAVLNVNGFYDSLLNQMDHMVKEGFLKPENRNMLLSSDSPSELLEMLHNFTPSSAEKWINRDQT